MLKKIIFIALICLFNFSGSMIFHAYAAKSSLGTSKKISKSLMKYCKSSFVAKYSMSVEKQTVKGTEWQCSSTGQYDDLRYDILYKFKTSENNSDVII